ELKEKMKNDVIEYETKHGIDVNYKTFSVTLTDNNDNTIGVLHAFWILLTEYKCCKISYV
ncbi:unnamed protein product, partial [marine sediment metagenome]